MYSKASNDTYSFIQACTPELCDYSCQTRARRDTMSGLEEVYSSQELLAEDDGSCGQGSTEELHAEVSSGLLNSDRSGSETEVPKDCGESEMLNDFHQEGTTKKLLTSDPADADIDADVASFIQRMMTSQ